MQTTVFVSDVSVLENKDYFSEMFRTVSEYRQNKINALRFDKDKRLSLGAELLLKKALDEYGIELSGLNVTVNEFGKPYFKDKTDIYYNLSHSGTKVMCAVSNLPVGCDVEEIKEANLSVADKFFTAGESELIRSQHTDKEASNCFFRIWVLKESYIKCSGLGLSVPLDSFSIVPPCGNSIFRQTIDNFSYSFSEPDLDDGYKYACCVRNGSISETDFSVKNINI